MNVCKDYGHHCRLALCGSPVFLFFFAIVLISQSVILYALLRDTDFSVLLATLFHWAFNLINLTILDVIYETPYMMVSGIIWVIVAGIVAYLKRDAFFRPVEES